MAVTNDGKTRVLEFLETNLEQIALQNAAGEYFRNSPSEALIDGDTLILDLFLDETQGNESDITAIDTWGFGASVIPESGEQFSTDPVSNLGKTSAETLTVSVEIQVIDL